MPDSIQSDSADLDEEVLVDQTGRRLGSRALQTRQRILDATVQELSEKPMRDLRVIDIARRVGSSPATFYQYFKDIEDVVLHLSEIVTARAPEVVDTMIHVNWAGREGFERAKGLVEGAIDNWNQHGPVLRVRNNAADEGDVRFREVRERTIMPLVTAFTEEIAASQARVREAGGPQTDSDHDIDDIDPQVAGLAIFAILDRMSTYHKEMEEMGISREKIVNTSAALIHQLLTSRI